ncbi:MAG: hypothetical protein JXR84_07620 [Anaerolineae bacterium]|nr:hypothetical protein [Anaerolineae bacterium]
MKKRMIVIGVMLLLILAMSTTVSAQVVRIPFTSVGTLVEILDPGKWSYPGNNAHVRDMVELIRTESADERITGWHTLVANGNWDANGYGPIWGTFVLDVDAYDGTWEGSYTGVIDENGLSLRMQAHGYGDLSDFRIEGTYLNGVTNGEIIELPTP